MSITDCYLGRLQVGGTLKAGGLRKHTDSGLPAAHSAKVVITSLMGKTSENSTDYSTSIWTRGPTWKAAAKDTNACHFDGRKQYICIHAYIHILLDEYTHTPTHVHRSIQTQAECKQVQADVYVVYEGEPASILTIELCSLARCGLCRRTNSIGSLRVL